VVADELGAGGEPDGAVAGDEPDAPVDGDPDGAEPDAQPAASAAAKRVRPSRVGLSMASSFSPECGVAAPGAGGALQGR
jgi:hypothetical protein